MRSILFLLLLFSAGIVNSQSIKLKVAGITDAAGEEVLAFETSDTLAVTGGGGGSGSSTPRFETVKIKKLRGTSTNEFFKRSIGGTHTIDMTFEFYDAGGTMYYKIVIKDVVITHFSFLSPECSSCSKLFHQLWLDYRKIEWTDVATGNTTKYDVNLRAFYN